jgi:hypothetical protein
MQGLTLFESMFPEEMKSIEMDIIRRSQIPGTTEAEISAIVFDRMRTAVTRYSREVDHAPARELAQVPRAAFDIARKLQASDPDNCAAMMGFQAPDLTHPPALTREEMLTPILAVAKAVKAARATPVTYKPPTDDQKAAFAMAVIAKGGDLDKIEALMSGGGANMTSVERCAAGVAIMGALADAAPEVIVALFNPSS